MNNTKLKKILVVFIEPASYMIDLVNQLYVKWDGQIDVIFLHENLTQNWGVNQADKWRFLPHDRFKKLIFFLRTFKGKYDLIHLPGWAGDPMLIFFYLYGILKSVPITVTSDTHYHSTSRMKALLKKLIYPVIFRNIAAFFPGGKNKQVQYLEIYGAKPDKIYPVSMTVDVTRIKKYLSGLSPEYRKNSRSQYEISGEDVVFLFVGRLLSYKGINDLMVAFNEIKNPLARLIIVGSGPLSGHIQELASLDFRIQYLGRLKDNLLLDIYNLADVFVLPSHFEPWGLVVNEAMAAGKPVIVSDQVGCADDLVVNQKTGFIVRSGKFLELKNAMEEMINSSSIRLEMGANASELIEGWTLENQANIISNTWSLVMKRFGR